jgi:hypothetical protein
MPDPKELQNSHSPFHPPGIFFMLFIVLPHRDD